MYPSNIKFIDGEYRGLTFDRGTGPSERVQVNGKTVLANSTNFWYSGDRQVSAEYLRQHKGEWTEADSPAWD